MTDSNLRRRSFLGLMGSGAPLGSLIVGDALTLSQPRMAVQPAVGVLLPSPGSMASRWQSFRDGLALGIESHGDAGVQVVSEEFGHGGRGITDVIGRMRIQGKVSAILGCLDARQARTARAACAGQVPFLDCGAGALVAITERSVRGYLECSLAHWQNAYAVGRWCAGMARRAAMVSTLYEAGYDALYAFRLGFEDGGGAIIRTLVVDAPGRVLTPQAVVDALHQDQPDAIYLALHNHMGPVILRALAHKPLATDVLLVANEFMAQTLSPSMLPAQGVMVCATYDPALATPRNVAFTQAYRTSTGRRPDQFAVLGYDAGCLAQILALGPLRETVRLDSPRGAITLDPALGLAAIPHYLCQLRAHPDGVQRQVLGTLDSIDEGDARIVALQRSIRSGWVNPYLSQ